MKLAANLAFLYKELPFLDRFAAARADGFDGVELLFPYDDPVPEVVDRLALHGQSLAVMNMPPPNYAGGARGFAAVPGGEERFRRDFTRALRFAQRLKARHLHVMAGKAEGPAARATFAANLAWAAAEAPGQSLVIEPVNPADMPGYFLDSLDLAAGVIAEVAAPNLGLQFDTYHAGTLTGDPVAAFRAHAPIVRHVQLAGLPGRHEPGDELDLAAFAAALVEAGYDGWLGAEYFPAASTDAGLGWMKALAAPA